MLDFTPLIAEELKFTECQSMGDSTCTKVTIVQDIFVETMGTFKVQVLPNHNDPWEQLFNRTKARLLSSSQTVKYRPTDNAQSVLNKIS